MARDRKEIDLKYTWDIDKMFSSKEEIDNTVEKVKEYMKICQEMDGAISESVDNFYNALSSYENASRLVSHLYVYTHMKHHQDTRINENQAEATKAEMLSTELSKATSYIVPQILAMDEKVLSSYLEDPRCGIYKKMVDEILRDKPYTLSEKEEKILASVSDLTTVAESTYEMLTYADMKFPEIEDEDGNTLRIDHFNYSKYIKSKDRRVRKDAFNAEFETYKKYSNTMAQTLFGAIKYEIFGSKVRNFPSALFASLYSDNISVDVYENLIKSVHENIHHLDRYIELKKKYFGLDDFHMYDLYTPMSRDFKMEIPYEKAKEIILEALKPMGEEYISILKKYILLP